MNHIVSLPLFTKNKNKVSEFLKQLSDIQRQAAEDYNGPTMIVAGAGSGKTRVLTARIAYMISCGVPAYGILALTFTNKAASEMRERISNVVGQDIARKIWMGTFHSVFSRILRAEADKLGFTNNFTIYETSDSRNLVKQIVKDMNLNDEKYKPKDLYSRISYMKNNLVTPQIYKTNTSMISEDTQANRERFSEVYTEYMIRCKRNNAMDFDDLLLYTNILLRDNPDIVDKYQQLFKYVLVDEYQDTNRSQYLIVKRLCESHNNICVVGDDAQSIYSFRGAKIENILSFKKDYPTAKVYPLEQNYRSTQTIVNAANSVIEHNRNKINKKSFSRNDYGEKIELVRAYTEREEAISVAKSITSIIDSGESSYKEIAILYRTNSQSRVFEEILKSRRIPYKIFGGLSFYQRAEIKNILAYARLVVNSNDNEALLRIINTPARGIGDTTMSKITEYAANNSMSIWTAIKNGDMASMGLKGATANKLSLFISLITDLKELSGRSNVYETIYEIASRSSIIGTYKNANTPESESAYQNIEELLNSVKQIVDDRVSQKTEIPNLEEWLQDVTLMTDEAQNEDKEEKSEVSMMTIHSAKGLEYKHVFIVGVEEGIFPGQRSATDAEAIEEERRLFYVAITRAVSTLCISFCLSRYKWGSSIQTTFSRFLKDIDTQYISSPELLISDDSISETDDDHIENSSFRRRYGASSANNIVSKTTAVPPSKSSVNTIPYDLERKIAAMKRVMPSNNIRATVVSEDDVTANNVATGLLVYHNKFGNGTINSIDNSTDKIKLMVNFDVIGNKTLLLDFAKLKIRQ